jgi:hypothetical protein
MGFYHGVTVMFGAEVVTSALGVELSEPGWITIHEYR